MKRKLAALILIGLSLLGSFITFYATNLLLSDVSNYAVSNVFTYMIASLPMFFIAVSLVICSLYVIKLVSNYQDKALLTKRYALSLLVIQFIGLITSILTGTIVYHSFTVPYPFAGYSIIMMIVYIINMALLSYLILFKLKEVKLSKSKRGIKELYYVLLGIFIYYAYNKFGAFMWSITYAQARTLYMSCAFYLSLLLPMFLLVQMVLYIFNYYDNHQKEALIHSLITLGLDVILTSLVSYFGLTDTRFISVISPATPLERLVTVPIGTIVHVLLVTLLSFHALTKAIKNKKSANI